MTHFKIPASEYMSSPILTISATAQAHEADALLERHDVTALGVTDEGGSLVGVLSRTDLLRAASGESGATLGLPDGPVRGLMSPDPLTVSADTTLDVVAKKMLKERFHRVFVARDGEPVGVVSTRDMMRAVHDKRVRAPVMEIASTNVMKVKADDTISLAVERLDASNRHGLIVTDGGWPVGTFAQPDALAARARDPRDLVEDAMELRVLSLPHEMPMYRAAQRALAMGVRRFVLLDGQRIVGVVSTYDFCRVVS